VAFALSYPTSVVAAVVVMTLVIAVRHRENLSRLRAGTEPRFVLKKQAAPSK
jgi:glycerol-3-phosphate acyltransferase PlsY